MEIRETSISVVIPTKNRGPDLQETLASLGSQTVSALEVLVVDQSDPRCLTDEQLADLVRAHDSGMTARYLWKPELSGAAAARNFGGNLAVGQVILFMDDDVTLQPGCLAGLREALEQQPDVGAIGAVDMNSPLERRFHRLAASFFLVGPFRDDRHQTRRAALTTGNAQPACVASTYFFAVRRECFLRHQFRESYKGTSYGEDVDFTYRVSHDFGLVIHPTVRISHRYSSANRADESELFYQKVTSKSRFYHDNLHPTCAIRIALGWAYIGLFLHALWRLARLQSVRPVIGFCKGLRKVPFMKSETG